MAVVVSSDRTHSAFCFFKQKTAYEVRISDWSSDVCSSDLPAAGGATRFVKIGKTVQPETGKLLAWNNRLGPGACNPASIHHGMKVRGGVKQERKRVV